MDALTTRRRAAEASGILPDLLTRARRIAATLAHGDHGRRQAGPGESFWQFRAYQPGDPPNRIDWRQTAKRAFVAVREREWQAAQSVWLWRAHHAGMGYRSAGVGDSKQARAELLVVALTMLLTRGGERVGLCWPDSALARPRTGGHVAEQVARALTDTDAHAGEAATAGEAELPQPMRLPRHGRLILVSDFLAPLESIQASLRQQSRAGIRGCLVQVLDPAEAELPFRGRVAFQGPGTGSQRELVPRVEAIRDAYRVRLDRHNAELADLARRHGWGYIRHRTDRPPEHGLLALHRFLADRPAAGGPG